MTAADSVQPSPASGAAPGAAAELARVTLQDHGPVVVAAISGELDISNVADVGRSLTGISNVAAGLIVDLTALAYLDSTAISMLHDLARRLRQRSQQLIVVCPPDSPPRRVLELTALHSHTPVLDRLDGALAELQAEPA